MNLQEFLTANGLQKPLVAYRGDIFDTKAHHIAFGVHWRNSKGELNNAHSGFAALVAAYGWPELATFEFEKGKPETKFIKGKYFHALPIHSNEKNGWDEAPELICQCLNLINVPGTEVISCVLMGGGDSGLKYKATVRNIEGFIKTYKTVVLHIHDDNLYELLVGTGVVARAIPINCSLTQLPKVFKYGERKIPEVLELDQ